MAPSASQQGWPESFAEFWSNELPWLEPIMNHKAAKKHLTESLSWQFRIENNLEKMECVRRGSWFTLPLPSHLDLGKDWRELEVQCLTQGQREREGGGGHLRPPSSTWTQGRKARMTPTQTPVKADLPKKVLKKLNLKLTLWSLSLQYISKVCSFK